MLWWRDRSRADSPVEPREEATAMAGERQVGVVSVVRKQPWQASHEKIDMAAAPLGARRRASADNMARAAVALSGIQLEAELLLASRPTVAFGRVLIDAAQRVDAQAGLHLGSQFPGLEVAGMESEVAVQAIEWLRVRADELAAAAIAVGQSAVREEERRAVAA